MTSIIYEYGPVKKKKKKKKKENRLIKAVHLS